MLLHKKSTKLFRASYVTQQLLQILLLPFGYLFVCFMLLHKKSTKLFRASYVITTIVTTFIVTFLLLSSVFNCCTKKALI
jgi:hypothetical protein